MKKEDADEGITLGTWVKVSLHVGWRLICATLRHPPCRPPVDLGKVRCGTAVSVPPLGQEVKRRQDDGGKDGGDDKTTNSFLI